MNLDLGAVLLVAQLLPQSLAGPKPVPPRPSPKPSQSAAPSPSAAPADDDFQPAGGAAEVLNAKPQAPSPPPGRQGNLLNIPCTDSNGRMYNSQDPGYLDCLQTRGRSPFDGNGAMNPEPDVRHGIKSY